jgi:motility quorum-sensing regulator/GCU-specific mRNA interferase toxin
MSEKRKPTYDLEAFKAAFDAEDKLQITGSVLKGAAGIGFRRAEIVATIQTMRRSHFYKSMTAYADNRLWQDVSTTSRPRPERFTSSSWSTS